MLSPRSPFWPRHLPTHLTLPATNLFFNAEVAATRYPDKPFVIFYDTPVTFGRFKAEAEWLAGYLQQQCGVSPGDRVLLNMQNSPQWMIAYYAILRANAVVVPVNPMNTTDELRHYVEDSGARTAIIAQDLHSRVAPLVGDGPDEISHLVVASYSDYVKVATEVVLPDFVVAPRYVNGEGIVHWMDALDARIAPGPLTAGPNELAVMPYTSGTTGKPKGCMHTHHSVMFTAIGGMNWFGCTQDSILLSVLPLFHVTGMQGGMNSPLYTGSTVVVLPRWDRDAAAHAIAHNGVTNWQSISTMVIDFLGNPNLGDYDFSSLRSMRGGGATMPEAIVKKLKDTLGLDYVEGYGMSETMAATHINPPQRPKAQCLGVPLFDVEALVVDPTTFEPMPVGQVGEIVVRSPQVMQGYWRNSEATDEAFADFGGKRYLRTGDLGHVDGDGYFFMADRLKRMINASGYKVWPAEVESMMYHHPAIQEVCVVGTKDDYRGETVKAFVVLRAEDASGVTPEDIMLWARNNMAPYKAPRIVELLSSLPKSGTGKVMWRALQEQEMAKATAKN